MPLVKRGELLSPLLLSLYGASFWSRKHCFGSGVSGVNIQEQGKRYLQEWKTVLNQLYLDIPFSRLEFPDAWKYWSGNNEYLEQVLSEITDHFS